MRRYLSFGDNPYLSIYLIFGILTVYLVIHIFNGRFTMPDFEVYYRAAGRLAGGQNLYRIAEDGHYVFKYSPTAAFYFIPIRIFPLQLAKILYWLSSSLAFCSVLILFYRIPGPYAVQGKKIAASPMIHTIKPARQNLLFMISFLCIGSFFELEIHLGQVNIFILFLLVSSAFCSMRERVMLSGLLLSLSIFLKPFGLILALYFLYRGRIRELLYFLAFTLILYFIPLLFYSPIGMYFGQTRLWFGEMIAEMSNKQDLLAPGTHTLFSILVRYTPLRWMEWDPARTKVFQLIVLLLIGGTMIGLRRIARGRVNLVPFELALLLCLVPLLAYTNRNLYIFSGLAVAVLLIGFGSMNWILRSLFIFGIVISSFNIVEILGEKITYRLEDWSFIALGTTILWIVLYLFACQGIKADSRRI